MELYFIPQEFLNLYINFKHMRKILFCLVIVFSSIQSQAQTAKELLDEVSAKVASYKNIAIDFKYGLSNTEENLKQDTRGNVTLQGNKYLLNLMGTTQLFDGENLYVIIPEDEEINISKANEESDLTPSKMLTFYKKGYKATMDVVQNVQGRKIQYVKLVPTATDSEIESILLGIDKETKHIYRQILKQKNGSEITITVNSFKTDQPLSNTLFNFDESKYKDYYINRVD